MIEIEDESFIRGFALRYILSEAETVGQIYCINEQLYAQMLGLTERGGRGVK